MPDVCEIGTRGAYREFQSESILSYYRARYYDPTIGRFFSEDPNDQGSPYDNPNLYDYVENNPANWIDPLGAGGPGAKS
jgi:RHS repeat-associated protein